MQKDNLKVGIIGLGLLGGSIVKSLRENVNNVSEIVALDKNEDSLKQAIEDKVIDEYSLDVDDKFSMCDIIFICTPVTYILSFIEKLEKIVKADCIITDTGSTKKTIIENVPKYNVNFIGGHPMVGSERSGYLTSKSILFENAYYLITKSKNTSCEALELLKYLIEGMKAIPIIIDEENHDYITASISHIPHLVAYTLVNLVQELDDEDEHMKTLAAGGFKDITRIASSDPTMWEGICFENKDRILEVLDRYIEKLDYVRNEIEENKSLYDYFDNSKKYRDSFINRKINGNSMPELNISVKDENGAIANVVTLLAVNNIGIKNIEVLNNRENNFGALRIVINTFEERDKAFELLKNKNYDLVKIN